MPRANVFIWMPPPLLAFQYEFTNWMPANHQFNTAVKWMSEFNASAANNGLDAGLLGLTGVNHIGNNETVSYCNIRMGQWVDVPSGWDKAG